MEYEERVTPTSGNYIVASGKDFENILGKVKLNIKGLDINVGESTDMYGFFDEKIKYCGMLDKRAIFYLGQGESDLFREGGYYYDVTYILSDCRILKMYRRLTARDYWLIEDENGKLYWK
jgi:hypothetical protein